MIYAHTSNYLSDYESAAELIKANHQNIDAKHKAVLALARMGSLDFAQSEYRRYRLNEIRHHEDIMSLGGRLSKDLYLSSSGQTALNHARESADKYERAFQDTQGYYSGINAATMAFLADMPWDIVKSRVSKILELLPETKNLSSEEHYFMEATRAECLLLLGHLTAAKEALRNAIEFDPLNYPAHASTLKQFRLIIDKRATDSSWLATFEPPRAIHFAGHIWEHSNNSQDKLPTRLSDAIQSSDIGFAYGALAAGADILIAEALLAEGVELNLILPTDLDSFIEQSVQPFGEAWVTKFHVCVEQSHSVTLLPKDENSSFEARTLLAAHMAMGQAILRGETLNVKPLQLLVNDPNLQNSLTAGHKSDWAEASFSTLEISLQHKIAAGHSRSPRYEEISVLLSRSDSDTLEKYDDLEAAIKVLSKSSADMHGLHFDISGAHEELSNLMNHNQNGNILVSESIANLIALKFRNSFDIVFAGITSNDSEHAMRCYNLKPIN